MKRIVCLFVCLFAGSANAGLIVDTGSTGSGTPWSLNSSQWLAGEFSISQDETITDLEGFLWGRTNSTLTAVIYSDGGDLPGSELFSSQFTVNGPDNWYGAHGLNWFLSSGSYWASFEVRAGDTYSGSLPGSAINPLGNEAFTRSSSWAAQDSLNLGIRISANHEVPEPASIALLGLGLAGIGFSRKKKTP